jgi:hypothetical protein
MPATMPLMLLPLLPPLPASVDRWLTSNGTLACVENDVAEVEGFGYTNGGCGGKCMPSALPGGVSDSVSMSSAALAEALVFASLGVYASLVSFLENGLGMLREELIELWDADSEGAW